MTRTCRLAYLVIATLTLAGCGGSKTIARDTPTPADQAPPPTGTASSPAVPATTTATAPTRRPMQTPTARVSIRVLPIVPQN